MLGILCNPSPKTSIHFAQWWGLFCSWLDIHNDKKSYWSLYSNLSSKSRSTSSFRLVAYVVCSGSKLRVMDRCLLCSSSQRCGCCQDEGCVFLEEVRRGCGPSGVKRKVAWDNSKDVQGCGHLIAACKYNLCVVACEAVSVWCNILKA
jgi:hypothetical protein